MTSTDILAKRTAIAHKRVAEIIEANASEERAAEVRKHANQAHVRNAHELADFQSQALLALAEMYEDLASKQSSGKSKKAS